MVKKHCVRIEGGNRRANLDAGFPFQRLTTPSQPSQATISLSGAEAAAYTLSFGRASFLIGTDSNANFRFARQKTSFPPNASEWLSGNENSGW